MSRGSSTRPRPETKSIGLAHYRNQLEEKSLGRRLEELRTHFRGRYSRLRTEMGLLEDHLKLMSPVGNKPVICPKGLTEAEKAEYRKLRRNSYTPSMSLKEFDAKMTDFRQTLTAYRRKSLSTNLEDTVFDDAGIIDLEEHEFCAPLTKHKHTMKEALKRATTPKATDISPQFLHAAPKTRRQSESSSVAVSNKTTSGLPTQGKSFRRSISQPGNGLPETVSVVGAEPSTSGTSRTSRQRPLTAHPSSMARRTEKPAPRCKSASVAGRHGDKRPKIVLCPDYIAARRMSVETVSYVDSNKTRTTHLL